MATLGLDLPSAARATNLLNPQVAGAEAGLQNTITTATGEAAAEQLAAQGALAQTAAYQSAANISGENAKVAGIAGQVMRYQQQLELQRSLGSTSAAVGASGAAMSGSALDILRSSMQQGALGGQLIDIQTALTQGGYFEQQGAAGAEVAASNVQAASATALSNSYTAEAAQAAAQLKAITDAYPSTTTIDPKTGLPIQTAAGGRGGTGGGGPPPSAYDASGNLLPGYSATFTGIGTSGYGTQDIRNQF